MKSKMIIISSCIAFFVLGLVFLPGIVYDLPFFEPIDFSQFKYVSTHLRASIIILT